jgi:hypothetical protein
MRHWKLSAMWDLVAALLGVGAVFALYLSARNADTRIAAANERASSADERAAALEKDAAQLRLDLEREREKRLGRSLTKKQFDILQTLKGKVTRVNVMWEPNVEAVSFANQIIVALDKAGIAVRMYPAPPGTVMTGMMIFSAVKPDDDPLVDAFNRAGFLPGWGNISVLLYPDVPHDVPLIQIGERFLETKPPYFGPPPPNP